MSKVQIVFPLDVSTLKEGYSLSEEVIPYIDVTKVGLEFIHSVGTPALVTLTREFKKPAFFDVKLNDIPNTVKGAARALARHGVAYFNVMASGGRPMMEAAMEGAALGAKELGIERPGVIAVTVLTSLNLGHLAELGICPAPISILRPEQQQDFIAEMSEEKKQEAITEIVMRWAEASIKAGVDCILSSPKEARTVHEKWSSVDLYTPGIRMPDSPPDDQSRTMTPGEAVQAGSKFLVIGRPIRNPPEGKTRTQVVQEIRADIAQASDGWL